MAVCAGKAAVAKADDFLSSPEGVKAMKEEKVLVKVR
jgi:hypothetical protein